ncbi:group 1 glycosyl transferase [Salinisphaera sp. S4-8]|uniref:glycosyltransferase family 4 protein n=1 Tax=Salinisphaera sp. S4-8 TaxID=633357 RepID=UPI0033406BCD
MQKRIKILIITRNLPPLLGGMERLNWHMAAELAKYAEAHIVSPRGSAALKPEAVEVDEVPLSPLWRFIAVATWRAIRVARKLEPDIILAGSGLTAPIAAVTAKASGARSVAYVHGLDVSIASLSYRVLWLPFLRRVDRVIANSHATADLTRDIGVAAERIAIVHPGVDLPAAAPDPSLGDAFRLRYGLGNRRFLLSVGRLTQRKGLREFVVEVLPRVVEQHPDVLLVIIGDVPVHALKAAAQSPADIQEAANQAGVGTNIRFLGPIIDRDLLASAYRAAAVHVFPVRHIAGDPEGFGMVAVEAAAYGLPTVAYATGGVIDAVADGYSGHLVPVGQPVVFAECIHRLLDEPLSEAGLYQHAKQFAWPAFGQALAQEIKGLCLASRR